MLISDNCLSLKAHHDTSVKSSPTHNYIETYDCMCHILFIVVKRKENERVLVNTSCVFSKFQRNWLFQRCSLQDYPHAAT